MVTIAEMVKAGMHFGHQARRWNSRMAPYIYGERNGVHIIDLIQTSNYLEDVCSFVTEQSAKGKTFLFVGTKNQAEELIYTYAVNSDSFYVNHRWLGGMLTNWRTIRTSINNLKQLEDDKSSGRFERLPKKEAALKNKQHERLEQYLGGMKNMKNIPDIVIIIGQPEELNAVYECKKIRIKNNYYFRYGL